MSILFSKVPKAQTGKGLVKANYTTQLVDGKYVASPVQDPTSFKDVNDMAQSNRGVYLTGWDIKKGKQDNLSERFPTKPGSGYNIVLQNEVPVQVADTLYPANGGAYNIPYVEKKLKPSNITMSANPGYKGKILSTFSSIFKQ